VRNLAKIDGWQELMAELALSAVLLFATLILGLAAMFLEERNVVHAAVLQMIMLACAAAYLACASQKAYRTLLRV